MSRNALRYTILSILIPVAPYAVVWLLGLYRDYQERLPLGPKPGVVFYRLAFGEFWYNEHEGEFPRIERRFFLYDSQRATSPVLELAEAGPRVFRNGPQFMIGNYNLVTGERLFAGDKWLELQVRE